MRLPTSFVVSRSVIVLLTALLFLSIALGLDHRGPLLALGPVADDVQAWFALQTEVLFA